SDQRAAPRAIPSDRSQRAAVRRLRVHDDDRVEWNRSIPHLVAAATGTKAPDWAVGVASLLALPLLFIVARCSPILVAIALGRSDISLGNVWEATRRNTWRLVMGPLVCLILLALPGTIMFQLGGMSRLSAAIVLTVLDLTSIIGGVVGVSFLSLAFRHFFPMRFRMTATNAVPVPL